MTLVEHNRARVAQLRAAGVEPEAIATQLHLTVERVDYYLDDIELDEAIEREANRVTPKATPAEIAAEPVAVVLPADPELKRCPHCNTVKPLAKFPGRAGKRRGQVGGWCRECDSQRSYDKPATANRLVRNRAYHRAQAKLIQLYPDEFKDLYDTELVYAAAEAEGLAEKVADESGEPPEDAPRLRPGVTPADEDKQPRINLDWCPKCSEYHNAGHRCSCELEATA